jgi:hypothetical protein
MPPTIARVIARLGENPQVIFHFASVGSGWINQIETGFGILTWASAACLGFFPESLQGKQSRVGGGHVVE